MKDIKGNDNLIVPKNTDVHHKIQRGIYQLKRKDIKGKDNLIL
jgi:hypothetical protein